MLGQKKPRQLPRFYQTGSVAGVFAPTRARLVNANFAEFGQQRLQGLPDPHCQVFAGRVFKARNVVQVIVIELLIDRFEHCLDLGEIPNPASMSIDRPGQVNAYLERMAVQPPALMPIRNIWQLVRRLKREFLENFHATVPITNPNRDSTTRGLGSPLQLRLRAGG